MYWRICFTKSFFDFSLLSGIPESWRAIAPLGLFEPWTAIVYLITTLSVIFAFQLVDFRPFTNLRSKQNLCAKQPYHGLLLGHSAATFAPDFLAGNAVFKIDPVTFMVKAPVSFLFGLFS